MNKNLVGINTTLSRNSDKNKESTNSSVLQSDKTLTTQSHLKNRNIPQLPPIFNNSNYMKSLPTESLLRIQSKLKSFIPSSHSTQNRDTCRHSSITNKNQDSNCLIDNNNQETSSRCCSRKIQSNKTMSYHGKGDFSDDVKVDIFDSSTGISSNKTYPEYDSKTTSQILDPEMTLDRLGYTVTETLDWSKVDLPLNIDLSNLLLSRIRKKINTDCKVYIGDEEFDCHLIVLQCYSKLFDSFTSIGKVEIPANKCSPDAFRFIYDWILSDEKSYSRLTRNNILDILQSATYLKIESLIEQCWAFFENNEIFDEATAFLIYVQAKLRNLQHICQFMLPRIKNFFLVLVSSQNWLELEVDDIKELLSSNYIKVNCEMEIFMSAVRWLRFDWQQRKQYRGEILKCVRFGNMTPLQLINIKRSSEKSEFRDIVDDPEVCRLIDDGLEYVTLKKYKRDLNDEIGLKAPMQRNWTGDNRDYTTYRDFLIYLDQNRRKQIIETNKRPIIIREIIPDAI